MTLLALFGVLGGVFAETVVTDPATEMVNGTCVTLQCMDTNGGDEYYFNGNDVKSATLSYTNIYKIVSDGADAFYLQRVSDSKYVAKSSDNIAMVDETASAAAFTFSIATATGWSTYDSNKYTNGTSTVRFATGGTYLNTQATAGVPKYAGGTGGYSIWYVKTYTQDEVDALNSTPSYPRVAQTVDEILDGHIYTIRSARNAITWNGSASQCIGASLNADNDNHKFVAVKCGANAGRFYFYNIGAGKFMSKSDNNASLTDTPEAYWTIKAGGNASYPLMMDAQDGDHFNFGGSGQITVDWWSTADDGNRLEFNDFDEADESLIAAIKATYSPKVSTNEQTYFYAVKNFRSGKYAAWTANNTQITQVENVSDAACWYLKDGKLYNVATDKVYAGISNFTDEGAAIYVKENPYNPTYFCISLTENLSGQCWDDNNGNVGNWNPRSNDYEGTSWTFEPVSDEQLKWFNFNNLLSQINAMTFGDQLGQYAIEGFESEMINAVIGSYAADFDEKAEENYEDDMDGMQMMLDYATLNMPKAGSFLVIQGTTGNKYMNGHAVSAEESVMWYGEDNKLITYSTGFGFKNTSEDATISDVANTQTFSEAQTPGTYLIVSNATGVGQYMYENTSAVDRYGVAAHDRKRWNVSYATSLPITLTAIDGKSYSTFFCPVAVTLPTGVQAYVVTKDSETHASLTLIESGVVPANTGVVLYSKDGATSATLTIGGEAGSETSELTGNAATIAAVECATLQNGANGVGLYKFNGSTLKGFKAYLPASSGIKSLVFNFDEETLIKGIEEAELKAGNIYDMSGRQVGKAQKGLYIQNGKKFIVK